MLCAFVVVTALACAGLLAAAALVPAPPVVIPFLTVVCIGSSMVAGHELQAAITGLRQHSTPYHLAHGLLDHAEHLLRAGDDKTVAAATGEAVGIAQQLGCQPLLDRAEITRPTSPRATAS